MKNLQSDYVQKQLETLKNRWGFVLFIGILLILLGTLAILGSVATTLLSVFLLGVILLAGGLFQLFHAFTARTWGGVSAEFLVGILYGLTGILLLAKPVQGAASLTLLLAILFFASGLYRSIVAIYNRPREWGWLLASGLISLLLGALIFAEWPESSLWVIGAFIGIDLLFSGWTLVMLSIMGNKLQKQ